jgi:hypothetical protein
LPWAQSDGASPAFNGTSELPAATVGVQYDTGFDLSDSLGGGVNNITYTAWEQVGQQLTHVHATSVLTCGRPGHDGLADDLLSSRSRVRVALGAPPAVAADHSAQSPVH